TYLGYTLVTTDGNGDVAFASPPLAVPASQYVVSATATNTATGETSEFSIAFNTAPTIQIERVIQPIALASSVGLGDSAVNGIGYSFRPILSANGRYLAFVSSASNLVPGVANGYQIYVKDLQLGGIVRASANAAGTQANDSAYNTGEVS